jgi:malonate transporter
MTYVIIHALAPVFIIMLLGFMAGKMKLVDNSNVSLLNIFVMDFALPAALFSATVKTPWAGILHQSQLIIVLALSMWITYAVLFALFIKVFKKSQQDAAVLTLTLALPNYAALGLPILGSIFGETSSTSLTVAISIACGSVLMTPFCLMSLEAGKMAQEGKAANGLAMLPVLMGRSLKKPIVWGPLLGVILSAIGVQMPELFLYSIKPLALSATAAALFLTGVILSARKLKINAAVLLSTFVKNLVQPAIAIGVVHVLGIAPEVGRAGVLLIALSAGFFGVVFGNRFKVQSPDAEGTLLLSSVLAIATIPLYIMLTA